jgi:hypothetical protein
VISRKYPDVCRLIWPVVTFQIKYPVGMVPLDGSTATAAGLICFRVPGVPATVQTHSPRTVTVLRKGPWRGVSDGSIASPGPLDDGRGAVEPDLGRSVRPDGDLARLLAGVSPVYFQ